MKTETTLKTGRITRRTRTPFLASVPGMTMVVTEVNSPCPRMTTLLGTVLSGVYMNDRGNYHPGDRIRVGPIIANAWTKVEIETKVIRKA